MVAENSPASKSAKEFVWVGGLADKPRRKLPKIPDQYEEINSLPRKSFKLTRKSFRISRRKSKNSGGNGKMIRFSSPKMTNNNVKSPSAAAPDFKIYDDIYNFTKKVNYGRPDATKVNPMRSPAKAFKMAPVHKEVKLGRAVSSEAKIQRSASYMSISDVIGLQTPPPPLPPRNAVLKISPWRRRMNKSGSTAEFSSRRSRLFAFNESLVV